MRILFTALFVALGSTAQAQNVIQADFIETMTHKASGRTMTVTGSHFFSMTGDGAYRIDRLIAGERTSEIWLPGSQERITINHTLSVAQRGSWTQLWNVPSRNARGGPRRQLLPMLPSPGSGVGGEVAVSQGQRAVGPLLLTGDTGMRGESTVESWFVAPGTIPGLAVVPVLEETVDGPNATVEMRLTSVTRVANAPSLFEAPPGLPVEQMTGPRRR